MEGWPVEVAAGLLSIAFAYAAWSDWRTREVSDRLWQGLAIAGVVLGLAALAPPTALGLALWLLVGGLAAEHLFPWDEVAARSGAHWPDLIEIVAFAGVIVVLAAVGVQRGIGPSGVPLAVVEAFVGIGLARLLYELRLLYGGADAKGLIAASITLPVGIAPVVALPPAALSILSIYPFSLTLLMNAALVAVAIPVALAIRNAYRGEFAFPRAFTGFSLPVERLPDHFVWLKEPLPNGPDEAGEEAETSAEDRAVRTRQRDALRAQGVTRAWVSPQIPFLVLMFVGVITAWLVGNLIFDLLALL